MRLASFALASLALHAGALTVFPGSHLRVAARELIPVVLISADDRHDESPGSSAPARGGGRGAFKSAEPTRRNEIARPHGDPQQTREANSASSQPVLTTAAEGSVAVTESPASGLVAAVEPSRCTGGLAGTRAGLGDGQNGSGGRGDGPGGDGQGGNGSGGSGSGSGGGSGVGHKQVQAVYRTTAKPDYPERARREGKEGRVLLRVLVDIEGRCEIVQIDTSSGSELLDHAARDAVKRWRFSPARDGDKAVASWVKVPIDFRLSDARN